MNDKKNIINIKTQQINKINNKLETQNKNSYENIINNNLLKTKSNCLIDNNDNKHILINDENNIKSINIINNNYNNIIINNKLTPNKKLILKDKTFSINKKNYKIMTLGNKQDNLQKEKLKLILTNQKQDNDIEYKYKLILNEKNFLINKLKNEIEYYKNKNPKNINNIIVGLKNKKTKDLNNIKTQIKTIFSQYKKEAIFNNHNLLNESINEYNKIKTNSNINSEERYIFIPQINEDKDLKYMKDKNINDDNKLNKLNNKLMVNYSLKNNLKLKNKLSLDLSNNFNSIEANTNRIYKYVKSPNFIYTSNSINKNNRNIIEFNNNSNNINDNCNDIINKNNTINRRPSFKNWKKNKYYFNNILKKDTIDKKIINDSNLDSYFDKYINKENNNDTISPRFNYKQQFDNLKNRMNNLIENLFDIIELQNIKKK